MMEHRWILAPKFEREQDLLLERQRGWTTAFLLLGLRGLVRGNHAGEGLPVNAVVTLEITGFHGLCSLETRGRFGHERYCA